MRNMSVCEWLISNIHFSIRWDSSQCRLSVSRTRLGKVHSDAQYLPSPDRVANHTVSSSYSSPVRGSLHNTEGCIIDDPTLSLAQCYRRGFSVSPLRKKSSSSWGARPSACSIFMVMLKEKSSLCLSNRPVKWKQSQHLLWLHQSRANYNFL